MYKRFVRHVVTNRCLSFSGRPSVTVRYFTSVLGSSGQETEVSPHHAHKVIKKPGKGRKYRDSYKLSEEEISEVLMKPKSKPQILHAQEVNYNPSYQKDIQDLIKERLKPISQSQPNPYQETLPDVSEEHKEAILSSEKKDEAKDKAVQLGKQNYYGVNIFRESDRPDVKYYKYELPIPNIDPEIEGLEDVFERARQAVVTPNMQLWDALALDKNSSFQDLERRLQETYQNGLTSSLLVFY